MIPLTNLSYELSEAPEKILQRLKWSVEEEERSWRNRLNYWYNSNTSRAWIGEVDEEESRFYLREPIHFFNRNFYVIIGGHLEKRASTNIIQIKLGVDILNFIFLFFFYAFGTYMLIEHIIMDQLSSLAGPSLLILAYPVYGTLILRKRMKRAEELLDQKFG